MHSDHGLIGKIQSLAIQISESTLSHLSESVDLGWKKREELERIVSLLHRANEICRDIDSEHSIRGVYPIA